MKNYYELLEVSEKASPEVIKKAYTTLVKKYHPDLQPEGEKKAAEEKIKEINEAYEILSDENKRANYDRNLQIQKNKEEQAKYAQMNKNQYNNSASTRQNQNSSKNNQNYNTYAEAAQKRIIRTPHVRNTNINYDDQNNFDNFQNDYNNIINQVYNNAYNEAYNNAYNQAYINNLRNMGYDIKYERPFKEKLKIAFSTFCGIIVFIIICVILWHIPFIKNYFTDLYNSNDVIKFFVDLINHIFQSIFSALKNSE